MKNDLKNVDAIIQARMGSSRLPGKVMMKLLNKPVLWHVVNRVKKSKNINRVIIATTIEAEDDAIEDYCLKHNFELYRGSSEDVLDRYYKCAVEFGIDNIVRLTADCPLHDSEVIDKILGEYLKGEWDYVTNVMEYTYPDGLDVEVFPFYVLKDAWEKSKLPSEREHVTPWIRNNTSYQKLNVLAYKNYPNCRLTLDYPEDYKFINAIYNGIGSDLFSLDQIIDYIIKHPQINMLNTGHTINEGYQKL